MNYNKALEEATEAMVMLHKERGLEVEIAEFHIYYPIEMRQITYDAESRVVTMLGENCNDEPLITIKLEEDVDYALFGLTERVSDDVYMSTCAMLYSSRADENGEANYVMQKVLVVNFPEDEK